MPSAFDEYRGQGARLRAMARAAASAFGSRLGAGATEEGVAEYLGALASTYGAAAGALAASFFEEATGKVAFGAAGAGRLSAGAAASDARAVLDALARDGADDAARVAAERADVRVCEAKASVMEESCRRGGVRWARVPAGRRTCPFCVMLASRGFVYTSERAAGGWPLSAYHPGCDCEVVPETSQDLYPDYDPAQLYEGYDRCRQAIIADAERRWDEMGAAERAAFGRARAHGASGRDDFLARQILAEMRTRDRLWLSTGEPPAIEELPGARAMPKEWAVAERLADNGLACQFLPRSNVEGVRTPDMKIGGLKWEIKQPTGDKQKRTMGKNTLDHQFEEASSQARRIVLDLTVVEGYESVGDSASDRALQLFHGKWKASFDEMIVVGGDGISRHTNA